MLLFLLTLVMLSLLREIHVYCSQVYKPQYGITIWDLPKCHVGILWKALAEYYQMIINAPWFLFFHFFQIILPRIIFRNNLKQNIYISKWFFNLNGSPKIIWPFYGTLGMNELYHVHINWKLDLKTSFSKQFFNLKDSPGIIWPLQSSVMSHFLSNKLKILRHSNNAIVCNDPKIYGRPKWKKRAFLNPFIPGDLHDKYRLNRSYFWI